MRSFISLSARRRLLAVASAGALLISSGIAVAVTATPAHAQTACEIDFNANPWGDGQGGFTAQLVIRNLGSSVSGWSLAFTLPGSASITQGWSANWTQSGQNVTATDMGWNANLGTGGETHIGFNGTGYSSNPTSFTLNGVTCDGTGGGEDPDPPVVSLTSPSSGQQFQPGQAVTLSANASSPSSTINRVEFFVNGNLVGTDNSAPYSVQATGLAEGNHSATAVAFDNNSPQLSTTSSPVSFSVAGGPVQQNIVASPTSLTVVEGNSTSVNISLNTAPSGTVNISLATSGGGISVTPSSFTLTASNFSTGQNVTVNGLSPSANTITASATGWTAASVNVTVTGGGGGPRVPNPYAGAALYVNPDWSAAAQQGGAPASVYNQGTGIWLDRIAAITQGSAGDNATGLAEHLDQAAAQDQANGSTPTVIQVVVYNLPGRDCAALASNGELGPDEIGRYESEYIDVIAEIMARPQYANLRIVAIVEIDSLPNLVTNLNVPMCSTVNSNGAYVNGVGYALATLGAIPNVYNYVDAAHHGWIGWDSNFGPTAQKLFEAANANGATPADVHGFITNTANYSALEEPFIPLTTENRNTNWIDWNDYNDELTFAPAFRNRLVQQGFSNNIGMLIDTSRNGWGGANRPTGPAAGSGNAFVEASRIDRRIHKGNWCNQAGAGLGERPHANLAPGIHAFVWIKPPGESDGSSSLIPNDEGKGFDEMCDPTYGGNNQNNNNMSGALPNAPISGHWFQAQFTELLQNAHPPL